MTRLITEGREGRHVRNRVVTSFHDDMKHRSKAFSVSRTHKDGILEKILEYFISDFHKNTWCSLSIRNVSAYLFKPSEHTH